MSLKKAKQKHAWMPKNRKNLMIDNSPDADLRFPVFSPFPRVPDDKPKYSGSVVAKRHTDLEVTNSDVKHGSSLTKQDSS